ncbi:hypothetical protein [Candidatus Nitrospira bockiana]
MANVHRRAHPFVPIVLIAVTLLLPFTFTTADGPEPSDPRTSLQGDWDVQEEDKTYRATLDAQGNGTYTWQGGQITTLEFHDRHWRGTWRQSGNDREGGFDLLLSEDGTEARGVWWYTRVGDRKNIPPRQWGGSYTWTRVPPGMPTPAIGP